MVMAGACLVLGTLAAAPLAAQSIDAVKAAFVFNFVKFASWPEAKMTGNTLHICIGEGSLDSGVFAGWGAKVLKDRAVSVDIIALPQADIAQCHILFLSEQADLGVRQTAFYGTAVANHVLLVSDIDGFIEGGGHIHLFIKDSKLSFEVNLQAIEAADLVLSSQILRLASNLGS